jgi:hypothetical protein
VFFTLKAATHIKKAAKAEANHSEKGWVEVTINNN